MCLDQEEGSFVFNTRAFSNLPNLRTVTGNTVQRLGDYAFADSGVTDQIVPGLPNLQYVGVRSLQNTPNLGDLRVEGTITVAEYALEGSGVTSVVLTGSGITVSTGALKDCASLQSFYFKGMVAVPNSFFEGCVSLSSFNMEGIQAIGYRAFYGCTGLSVPLITTDALEGIGVSAFEGSGISYVNLQSHSPNLLIEEAAFKNCLELTSFTWSETYSSMPDSIFEGCIKLTGPIIPAGVRYFGEACLKLNEGLMCKEKIAIVIGVFVIVIIALVVVMVLIITGVIRCRKRDTD